MDELIQYYAHLHNSLVFNKKNSINQKEYLGDWVDNIVGYNYEESIENWYTQLFDSIFKLWPEYFVKTLVIYEDSSGVVRKISYKYFERSVLLKNITNTSIIIYRK